MLVGRPDTPLRTPHATSLRSLVARRRACRAARSFLFLPVCISASMRSFLVCFFLHLLLGVSPMIVLSGWLVDTTSVDASRQQDADGFCERIHLIHLHDPPHYLLSVNAILRSHMAVAAQRD